MALDDAPDAGQADAVAPELVGVVEPLERLEQLAGVGRVEAGPVIADVAADGGVAGGCGAELDGGAVAAGGEFPGVFELPRSAESVAWLASDRGRRITGVALPVDAGFTWSCSACSTVTSYAAKPPERSQTVP